MQEKVPFLRHFLRLSGRHGDLGKASGRNMLYLCRRRYMAFSMPDYCMKAG